MDDLNHPPKKRLDVSFQDFGGATEKVPGVGRRCNGSTLRFYESMGKRPPFLGRMETTGLSGGSFVA